MFQRIKEAIIVKQILAFLGSAPNAVRDHLNVNELVRIVVAAVMAGGGAYEAFVALAGSIPSWVAPGDVGLATGVLLTLTEVWRRLRQGRVVVATAPAAAETPPDPYTF